MPISEPECVLTLEDVAVGYGRTRVVGPLSLTVGRGEILCLLGRNGVGKTTLLRGLLNQAKVQQGTVRLAGTAISGRSPHAVARMGISIVPGGRRLVDEMSVRDNIATGALRLPRKDRRPAVDAELRRAETWLPALRDRKGLRSSKLSGGEQQIVALARALAGRPRLLVLDEPSLGLAPLIVRQLFDHLRELAAQGLAILVAEQNFSAALRVADRAHVLEGGGIAFTTSRDAPAHDEEVIRDLVFGRAPGDSESTTTMEER
ncbi:ABC transporter ATP-binding protein [Streptomyces phaeochromogenes]|uniref:ABC transporter ATP-binding protein n=1 Tax=Streptomyces phaeochromogenes TaxID=1923 RepID=UPI002DDA72D1|nr:ABC transporter ATP-binding protein [Streptomyces phaeochromogenes]WRZ34502.1 ABC transporter ATP-binding protein [Streptomyces phaeochromogenes]